jgi:hypothetical protein
MNQPVLQIQEISYLCAILQNLEFFWQQLDVYNREMVRHRLVIHCIEALRNQMYITN